MPRILNQVSSKGEGHYGRGIGDIDITSDLSYNPPISAGFVGPINPADYASANAYSAAVLSQWESGTTAAAANPAPASSNQTMVWIQNNWPLLVIGGIVGLLLAKGM